MLRVELKGVKMLYRGGIPDIPGLMEFEISANLVDVSGSEWRNYAISSHDVTIIADTTVEILLPRLSSLFQYSELAIDTNYKRV